MIRFSKLYVVLAALTCADLDTCAQEGVEERRGKERRDIETLPRSVASELGHGLLGKKAKIFFFSRCS